jgi:xanthine dehydrogenase YagS FAD-binding subunit
MRPLSYVRARSVTEAVALAATHPSSAFLAGGTTEIDLVRAGVMHPDVLVDIDRLPLGAVEELADGGVRIGALARMGDVASAPLITDRYRAVSQALLLGASPQLRNMASIGGNLRQRVRCPYFRDTAAVCNRRDPGTGCSALEGLNRGHAILGTSAHCIATHPSDLAVALVAFDAVIRTIGPSGAREVAVDDFFLVPGDTPEREDPLEQGELIVAVDLPRLPLARDSLYLKLRDRRSYEFALVSVAAALEVRDGLVAEARLALGGVGTKPWRARGAECELLGAPATPERFAAAAAAELRGAETRSDNAFKVPLVQRAIARALAQALDGAQR